jgi:predicted transcriptional regulator
MVVFVENNNRMYDVETIKEILNISRSKVQRELKKIEGEVIKYKNLFLYEEKMLFNLMEIKLIEKLKSSNDRHIKN